jgi:hypothetical protein
MQFLMLELSLVSIPFAPGKKVQAPAVVTAVCFKNCRLPKPLLPCCMTIPFPIMERLGFYLYGKSITSKRNQKHFCFTTLPISR